MKSAVLPGLLFILLVFAPRLASAAGDACPASFQKDIASLLQRRCAACHCEESAKGGYRLDTFSLLQKAGDGGDAPVIAGKAKESALFKLFVGKDPADRMPQKAEALPDAEIAMIENR